MRGTRDITWRTLRGCGSARAGRRDGPRRSVLGGVFDAVDDEEVERALLRDELDAELVAEGIDEAGTSRFRREFRAGRRFGQEFDLEVVVAGQPGLVEHRAAEVAEPGEGGDDHLHGDVARTFSLDPGLALFQAGEGAAADRKSTRLNSSHLGISYA